MINGAHIIHYSADADADRAFLRDVLGVEGVDAGQGWLILPLPASEVAVHPTDGPPKQELYLMCDDVEAEVAALRAKGVETAPISDQGWGLLTSLTLPGGGAIGLYQPRHQRAHG
ncbi:MULTISPECIES: VOC family protein [Tsukamurella]|uniref:Extradiol dioxygenase n=2 Tax=Tsukamurella TaxID=2060 RepID=A0A5C5S4A5_9ACTN|nr:MULTISPECIES: extradiol dioxygenase [Tsukamurella]NMD57373.1 extradiol dioxygenase [Tsukamurella columbiensis]TWS29894.1 extradiol dioxygenase [Tsukamurella conjunctivitidis]